jgi:hypothetical protein
MKSLIMASTEDSTAWLVRAWTHSHEEDVPGSRTFRPRERDFPPSRGRLSFELKSDGQLGVTGPGPDDRPRETTGTWSLDAQRLSFYLAGRAEQVFEVLNLEPERLVLQKLKG